MPPQPGSPGRAGQAYTALGSFGRALGAQSRFMPQAGTMQRRAARGGRAQEEQLAQNYQRWLDKVRRQERLSFYAGLARMSHEGALGIVEGRERAEQAQRIERAMARGREALPGFELEGSRFPVQREATALPFAPKEDIGFPLAQPPVPRDPFAQPYMYPYGGR